MTKAIETKDTQNNTQNEKLQEVITQFAKANRISKVKAKALAEQVMSVANGEITLTPAAQKEANKPAGKPVSPESQRIRNALLIMRYGFDRPVTSKEIAEQINASQTAVNNNLRFLASEGIVQPAGKEENTGKRGKASTLWQFRV